MTTWRDIAPKIIDDGPEIEEAVFNYIPTSQSIDAVAERANMWWRIDQYRRLHFVERGTLQAPFDITESDLHEGSINLEHSALKYRNQQIIKGPKDLTAEQTETERGDGEKRTFAVGYPIAQKPTIEIWRDSEQEWQPQDVGIKGIDDIESPFKDWYWQKGDNTVMQEDENDVLGNSDIVKITFKGAFPILVLSRANSRIINRQEVEEHGTGIVEEVKDEPQQSTREAALQLAAQLLEKYGKIDKSISFRTRKKGLAPGQLLRVNLPDYGLDKEFLVDNINISDEQATTIWYDVHAVAGPELKSWAKVFEELSKKAEKTIREGVGEEEIIIIPYEYEKVWTEAERPNIFTEKYPEVSDVTWNDLGASEAWNDLGASEKWFDLAYDNDCLYPGSDAYPSFAPADRVKYMAWYDADGERSRKPITQIEEEDGYIWTRTFVDAGEAIGEVTDFGWWGGIDATEEVATGVEIDKQDDELPETKTIREGWQVDHENKRWDY